MNFFDHYFTSPREENNPDEKGVKNDVVSAFSDVNKSDVYPVCGQWAFNAHISKIDPDAKQIVSVACMNYKHRRRNLPQADSEIDAVIEISGFGHLEEKYDFYNIVLIINRLSESVQRTCADKTWWEKNIYSQCAKFLNDCILVGNELLEKIESEKQSKLQAY